MLRIILVSISLIWSSIAFGNELESPEIWDAYVGFQKDADIVRLKHLVYYGSLIEEFKEVTGSYPFQGETDVPIYVHIASPEQQQFVQGKPSYSHETRSVKTFVNAIEAGLDREIEEYYDPQYRPDFKPNFYIYMITGESYFFAIHQHQEYSFAKSIGRHYNKVEISNTPNAMNQARAPDELFESEAFKSAVYATIKKIRFFEERSNKLLHVSKEH